MMILKMTLVARLPWHWCLPIVSQISAMSMLGPALLGQTASEHYLVSTFQHLLRYSMCFRIMGVHTSVYITEALVRYSDSVFKSEKRGLSTQIQNGERKSKRTHAKIWPFGKSVNQAAAPRLVWFWLPEACQSILYQEFCTHNMSNTKCFFFLQTVTDMGGLDLTDFCLPSSILKVPFTRTQNSEPSVCPDCHWYGWGCPGHAS